jgi:hypothetical protein
MIVDSHVHLVVPGFLRGKFVLANARAGVMTYNRIHKTNLTLEEYLGLMRDKTDSDGSKLIESMDEAGIDKSVIFGVDWAYAVTGEPRVSNREQNHFCADLAQKWEGRLIALAALDPRRPDVIEQAKQAIEEWGMKGFKLHPSAGFYPQDPVCFPLYEKCADWGVPIVFHSGGLELSWEYGQPMYIASASERFPEVKMVMAHAGSESWPQALAAAAAIPNVYLDISTRQMDFCINPDSFYRWLRNLIDWVGPWKILFASDAPLPTLWLSQSDWVKAIKEPATEVSFTSEEIEIILGKTAETVFDLA